MSEQPTTVEVDAGPEERPAPAGSAPPTRRPRAARVRRSVRAVLTSPTGAASAAVLAVAVLAALLADVLAPADLAEQSLRDRLQGPSGAYLLGTDDLGRDQLSRLLFATRTSLLAALQAVAIATVLGVPLGLLAGYTRGWFDEVASRFADAVMSIPAILLAIAIIGVLGPDLTNAMVAIGLVYAPRFFRVVRGSALAVREETWVEAARSIGCRHRRIIARHVLPGVLGPLVVEISLAMGFALLAEAGISFLGLGVQPPQPSLGEMLGRSTRFMSQSPGLVIVPGTTIMLIILAFNGLGDAVADALGQRARRGR